MPLVPVFLHLLIIFYSGPAEGCGGDINVDQTKYITAPNLENVHCIWTLTAPKGNKIEIKFPELNLPQTCTKGNRSFTSCDCSYVHVSTNIYLCIFSLLTLI